MAMAIRKLSDYKTPFSPSATIPDKKPSTSRRVLFSEVILQDDSLQENDSPKEEGKEDDSVMDDAGLSELSRRLALVSAYFAPDHRKLHLCSLQPLLSSVAELSDRLASNIFEEDISQFHQKEYPHLYLLLDNPSSPDFVKSMAYLRRQTTLYFVIDTFLSSLPPRKVKKIRVKKEETEEKCEYDSDSAIYVKYRNSMFTSGDDVTAAKSRDHMVDSSGASDHISLYAGRSKRTALASLQVLAVPTDSGQTDEPKWEAAVVPNSELASGPVGDSNQNSGPSQTDEASLQEAPNGQPEVTLPSPSDPACVLVATRHIVFLFDMLKLSPELVWNILRPLLEDTEVHKVVHNFHDTDYYFLRENRNISVKNLYDITYAQKRLENRFKGLTVKNNEYTISDFRLCFEQYFQTFRTFPAVDFVTNGALWKGRHLPSQLATLSSKHVRDVVKQIVYLDLIKRAQLELFMSKALRMTSLKVLTVFLTAPDDHESFKIDTEPLKKSDLIVNGTDDDSDFE